MGFRPRTGEPDEKEPEGTEPEEKYRIERRSSIAFEIPGYVEMFGRTGAVQGRSGMLWPTVYIEAGGDEVLIKRLRELSDKLLEAANELEKT